MPILLPLNASLFLCSHTYKLLARKEIKLSLLAETFFIIKTICNQFQIREKFLYHNAEQSVSSDNFDSDI